MARPRDNGSALGQRARCFHERKPAERDGESVGYEEGSAAESGQDGEPSWRKGGPRTGWETYHIWGEPYRKWGGDAESKPGKVEQDWVWGPRMDSSPHEPPASRRPPGGPLVFVDFRNRGGG